MRKNMGLDWGDEPAAPQEEDHFLRKNQPGKGVDSHPPKA
jgi:hypothetical protein